MDGRTVVGKLIQIRDEGTNIPALAWKFYSLDHREVRIAQRAGFSSPAQYFMLTRLEGGEGMETHHGPYDWNRGARTMFLAHVLLEGVGLDEVTCKQVGLVHGRVAQFQYDMLDVGGVLDVGYALGLNDLKEFE